MIKIDIHTHILPHQLPSFKDRYGYGGFITLQKDKPDCARMVRDDGKFFREIKSNCWDPLVRIQECEHTGVTMQVLSTIPVMFGYWVKPKDALDYCRFFNDHIAQVVADYPRYFVGLGTLPMQAPELAIKELERCMRQLGFAGVQIGSHVNDWNLNDEYLFPVFEAAQDLGAALFVHPWDMMGESRMNKYMLPWLVGMPAETSLAICSLIFGGVLERLPALRIAFAHGGGCFGFSIGRIERGFLARPDLVAVDSQVNPRSYLGRFYVDSLVHDKRALNYVLEVFGADKVALGSDYPFPMGEDVPGSLIASMKELDESVCRRVFYETACQWLARTPSELGLLGDCYA